MQIELSLNGMRAVAESAGGELVSLRDSFGTEYIWHGDPAFWSGRNPVLFPIVGRLKDGKIDIGGKSFEMAQHGFARRSEFDLVEKGEDYVVFRLCQTEKSLAQYPFAFSLQVCHRLRPDGFSTVLRVENTGDTPMPFCIGAHTAFCCPLREGERFEDYEIVFDEAETADMILLNEENLISATLREPLLNDADRFTLDRAVFDRLDTIILEGLRSRGVALRHKHSGHGVHMRFEGFPMIAFWTPGGKCAPFICLEPWHGCAAVDSENGAFTDKRHCVVLEPGESKELEYIVSVC